MTTTDGEPTKEDLLERARELDITGRSDMTKDELSQAIADAEGDAAAPIQQATPQDEDSLRNAIANSNTATGDPDDYQPKPL